MADFNYISYLLIPCVRQGTESRPRPRPSIAERPTAEEYSGYCEALWRAAKFADKREAEVRLFQQTPDTCGRSTMLESIRWLLHT